MTTATKYKTYPKYKPSGIDWLGDIPEGWKIDYLKNRGHFASSGIDKKIVEGEPLVQMVNYTDIYGNETRAVDAQRELMTVSCPAWKIPEANLIKGDLVFTPSSETTEDIGLSALIDENLKNTVFSYHVIRFRFSEIFDHSFKKYWCNNTFVWQQLSSFAKGTTRQILDRNDFKNTQVVIPPKGEQKKIADFLDRETVKIDKMVVKKQKMIELLKEKRQALITHAVTKGLNPHAKMKPSGIDWLGDVPEGWEVKRYKNVLKIFQGMAFKSNDYVEYSDVISIRMGNIKKSGYIDLEHNTKYLPDNYIQLFKDYILKENDLIIAMTDMSPSLDFLAVPALMKGLDMNFSYLLNQRVGKLIIDKQFNAEFLKYLLLSKVLRDQLKSLGLGTVQSNMSSEDLGGAFFASPSITEQKDIVSFLNCETSKIDEMIKKTEAQIEKLQEFRQALISNVVTGKVKV